MTDLQVTQVQVVGSAQHMTSRVTGAKKRRAKQSHLIPAAGITLDWKGGGTPPRPLSARVAVCAILLSFTNRKPSPAS